MILNFDDYPSLHGLLSSEDLDAMLSGRVERGSNFEVRGLLAQHSTEAITVEMSARVWTQDGRPVLVEVDCMKARPNAFIIQSLTISTARHPSVAYFEGAPEMIGFGHGMAMLTTWVNTTGDTLRPGDAVYYTDSPQAIGDTTCANNARSPHLRCAINPCGPCEGCDDWVSRKPPASAQPPLH